MVHSFVLDIDYAVIFYFSLSVIIAYIVFMYEHLSFTHTLIRSLLTTLDSHVQDFLDIFLYCSGIH